MKKFPFVLCFGLIIVSALFSCTSEDNLTIGNQFIRSDARLVCIDTLTVKLSTFKMDSLRTSDQKIALVGNYDDTHIGVISSNSYIIMGDNSLVLPVHTVLDSFVLVLKPNGYFYGDTLSNYRIKVHEVAQYIEPEGDAAFFCNFDTIECKPMLLGEAIVSPRPKRNKEIRIPIDGAFSSELFNKLRSGVEPFTEENTFVDFFKGIRLSASESNSILGFLVNDTSLHFTMYYHAQNNSDSTGTLDIKPSCTSFQFNAVKPAGAGSVIMTVGEDPVLSDDMNNMAYLQGGTGLCTRVEFPSLKNILPDCGKDYQIVSASLIVQPLSKMNYDYLPSSLNIYSTNKHNHFLSAITDISGRQVTSSFVKDVVYKENTYYAWDVTYYIVQLINSNDWDYNGIHIVPVDYMSTFDHVIIADQKASKYKTQLKLYVLYYE